MKIFVISLKSSDDRRRDVERKLANMDFEFFDADNLRANPEHFIYSLYDKEKTRKYKGYVLTIPELGCFASHISLWRRCVELDEVLLILEDNIDVSDDLPSYLQTIEELTKKYGILKLCNLFKSNYKVYEQIDDKYVVTSSLKKPGLGTQAYAISPRVAKAYLDIVPGFFEPVDNFIESEWRTKQTVYSLRPNLINRAQAVSTIGQRKIKESNSVFSKVLPELFRLFIRIRRAHYNWKYK